MKPALAVLSIKKYFCIFVLYLLSGTFILGWLFNVYQLVSVISSYPKQLPVILLEGYFNLFKYGLHFIPLIIILTAIFQSLAFSLSIFVRDNNKTALKSGRLIVIYGVAEAVCVVCSGSLLPPSFTIMRMPSAISVTGTAGYGFLILGLVIAMYSVVRMGRQTALIANNYREE